MNPLQIQYFITVADSQSFTHTAEALSVSQPAISKQIALMEEELGVKLFNREKRRAELTPAGREFYDFFVRTKQEYLELRQRVAQVDAELLNKAMSARIASFIDWDSSLFMSPMIEQLESEYPKFDIELETRGIYEMAPTLASGKFDIILCFDHLVPEQIKPFLNKQYFASVHRMLFASSKNPITQKENVRFSDFRNEKCIALYSGKHPEPQRTIRYICAQYDFEPQFSFKPNHDSVVTDVLMGRGYCIFDEWSRICKNSNFFTMELDVTRPVSIYWRKENKNPAIPIMVEKLCLMASRGYCKNALIEEDR